MTRRVRLARWASCCLLGAHLISLAGCGEKNPGPGPAGKSAGKIETAFKKAAAEHKIPERLLLAVALSESGLSPKPNDTYYLSEDNKVGLSLTETAFGLPMNRIGLNPEDPQSSTLSAQVNAYAAWVERSLAEQNLSLAATPKAPTEIYDWIWQLARLHREGDDVRKNVQILFALEIIKTLNAGALWQDPESGEMLRLAPESKPIDIARLPDQVQNNMRLYTFESEIEPADRFDLTYKRPNTDNKPRQIRVIHCPLSLSACLELQNPSSEADVLRLGAHYVIPPTGDVVKRPLQIHRHSTALRLTNNQGQPELVQDAVIVMLVGDSGRYVGGRRVKANPKWFTKDQLKTLGRVVGHICGQLAEADETIDQAKCRTPGEPGGVQFLHQGSSESYQWGDIPDFDQNIFWSYVNQPGGLAGDAVFQFKGKEKIYPAAKPVNFTLKFIRGAAKVVIERLERCSDDKLIWSVAASELVRNLDARKFDMTFFYQGANANGQHFLRALVYDREGQLMGWAIDDVYVKNYDPTDGPGADLKTCQRSGT